MLHDSPAFSGFSVDNLDAAEQFYRDTLGLEVNRDEMGLHVKTGSGNEVFVYHKGDHQPATFTILNFVVVDIKATVDGLKAKGVLFEMYPNMTDEDGIAWGSKVNRGPDIAWFKDPAGNFLSVIGK
jgi:catechol 2,3-dioxygenase-like lactoylglutathione lyase family enzyme